MLTIPNIGPLVFSVCDRRRAIGAEGSTDGLFRSYLLSRETRAGVRRFIDPLPQKEMMADASGGQSPGVLYPAA